MRTTIRSKPKQRGLLMVLSGCLLAASLQAQENEAAQWTRLRGGRASEVGALQEPAMPTAYLRWNNGDVLPGKLLEYQGDQIRWGSPIFADELAVHTEGLDAIVFSGRTVHPKETLRVGTTSGDLFTADLVGSDESMFLFSCQRYGEVRMARDAVYSLQRRVDPNLVFDGSQFEEWVSAPDPPIKDLGYKVYQEDRDWNGGEFPDLSMLDPVDEGRLAAGYLDLGLADVEGRFGMVFEGRLEIAKAGRYRFELWADDKARLFMDGKLVVEFLEMGRDAEAGGRSTLVQLGAGFHFLRAEYLELGGGFRLVAKVTDPDSRSRSLTGTNKGSGWERGLGGHPYTDRRKTGILREIELPKRFEMELELASSESPRFVLALGKDPHSAESMQSLRLETWGDELVVVQDTVFEPVMTIEKESREVRLRLALDSQAGAVTLFDADGHLLATVSGIQPTTGESGIYIRNQGRDLTVRRLSVYRQSNAVARQPLDSSKARVHLNTGQVVYGQLGVEEDGAFVVDEAGMRQAVDLTMVDRVASPDAKLTAASAPAELSYEDGSVLRGRVEGADADQVTLRTAFSETPIACKLSGGSTLRFDRPTTGARPPTRDQDQLFFEPGRVRGRLAFGVAGSPLGWKPEGAATALRLTAIGGARIERSSQRVSHQAAFDARQFPHVLHLKTGEIIPCRIVSYTQETLGLESPFVSGREIASTHVKGIEFTPVRKGLPGERPSETERWLNGLLDRDKGTSGVDAIRLERALTVPRFDRESPPRHILVAKTGDLKRGTLLSISGSTIEFESKLRKLKIPIGRISRVVDVSNPESLEAGDRRRPAAAVVNRSLEISIARATLADGCVLSFAPQESHDGKLSGHSPVYGNTTIPIDSIQTLTFGEFGSEDLESLFAEWVVRSAKEPEFSE